MTIDIAAAYKQPGQSRYHSGKEVHHGHRVGETGAERLLLRRIGVSYRVIYFTEPGRFVRDAVTVLLRKY